MKNNKGRRERGGDRTGSQDDDSRRTPSGRYCGCNEVEAAQRVCEEKGGLALLPPAALQARSLAGAAVAAPTALTRASGSVGRRTLPRPKIVL